MRTSVAVRSRRTLHWAAGCAFAASLVAPDVDAGEAVGFDWVAGEPGAEVAVTAGALSALTAGLVPENSTGWRPSWRRRRQPFYGTVSDITGAGIGWSWQLAASYSLETAYYSRHGVSYPARRAARTTLIDVQSALVSVGITMAIKRVTGRCRPRSTHGFGCYEHDGFPSGHTVIPASLAGSRLTLALRSTDARERYVAFGIAESMTLTTAALRMLAGAHSWEDVLAGWLIGHATGALLALAHPRVDLPSDMSGDASSPLGVGSPAPSLSAAAPLSFGWAGTF